MTIPSAPTCSVSATPCRSTRLTFILPATISKSETSAFAFSTASTSDLSGSGAAGSNTRIPMLEVISPTRTLVTSTGIPICSDIFRATIPLPAGVAR